MEFNFVLSFFLISSAILSSTEASEDGFSIEIISRDSPNSPFYNPDETPAQRIANAFRRSTNRARHFNSRTSGSISPETAESVISGQVGEYLMNISVGTPGFEIVAIADTGSDLIWTQCEPCNQCFQQNAPLFDPSNSTTYRDLSCSTSQCSILENTACSRTGSGSGVCQYQYRYGDSSSTVGNLAVDTLTLGSTNGRPVAIPKSVFGCGHQNQGTFSPSTSGIVGLGGGPVSLISQLGSTIAGKFSYCLVPFTNVVKNTSTLNFGSNAVVSGSGVQTTPLISKTPDTFYFLTLEAISVGTKRIEFGGSSFGASSGNIIIDSGTTLTLVPQDFFSELASEVEKQIGGSGTRVEDPTRFLNLCFQANSELKVPTLTVHFSGADIDLKPLNTFIPVSESVMCFTFNPTESGAIFGNLSQMDFLVGYDLQEKTVSFKATDCAHSS